MIFTHYNFWPVTFSTALRLCAGLVLILLAQTQVAKAGEANGCEKADINCVKTGTWEFSLAVGAGMRSNPVIVGDNLPMVLLPSIRYYGERLFVENFNVGYLLFESPQHEFNALASPSYEHMFFNEWSLGNFVIGGSGGGSIASFNASTPPISSDGDPNNSPFDPDSELIPPNGPVGEPTPKANPLPEYSLDDLHDRNLAMLGGLEYRLYAAPFYASLQVLQDVSAVHKGQEARASAMFEHSMQRHLLTANLGLIWQSAKALDYYYGIRKGEITEQFEYKAGAGASPFLRLDWHYAINKKWSWQNTLHYRRLSDSAFNSPLVNERDIVSVFFGGIYHF